MTLPITPEPQDEEAQSKRRDEIYDKIKHHLPSLKEKSGSLKDDMVKLVLEDMVLDHATSGAIDEIGMVLEYQAQAEGIERPRFNGMGLLKDIERVSKLDFSIRLARMLNLDDETVTAIRNAEIERLWGDGTPKKDKKDNSPVLKLPEELYGVLRDITKSLSKRSGNGTSTESRGHRGSINKPAGKVNGPK